MTPSDSIGGMRAPSNPRQFDPLAALSLVLGSIDAVRNTRALMVLLGTFAGTGLLVSMAEASLARGAASWWALAQAIGAGLVAFYGGNAAGILVMDDACGRPVRGIADALLASLRRAHRLLLVVGLLLLGYGALAGLLWALFWLCRTAVAGGVLGPALFGLMVPLGVLGVGLALLSLLVVVVPLTAPGVWAGAGVIELVRLLLLVMRRRLLGVTLLMAAVSVLTAGMGTLATFVVMAGGRVVAELGVAVVGVDVPAKQLMSGLFGYGLRTLGAAGAPLGSTGHASAALVGGGVVFALALVLPGLVYLRGSCAVYLALAGSDESPRRMRPPLAIGTDTGTGRRP